MKAQLLTSGLGTSDDGRSANYTQRHGILFVLFSIWVLAVPFHRYSVIGTYSLDNLLAPALVLLAILLPRIRDRTLALYRYKTLLLAIGLYTLAGLFGLLKFVNHSDLLKPRAWQILRDGLYFVLPMLYLRDLWTFQIMKRLLVWVTMFGAISVILVALAIIELPVARFAESRIGEGLLPKSVGLFSNYGDLSILYGFVSVLLISHGRSELGFLGAPLVKLGLWAGLLAGLAGSQSRNMLFGTLIAIAVYWLWKLLLNTKGSHRTAVAGLFVSAAIIFPGIIVVFGDSIVGWVSALGGSRAENTALQRLESYSLALNLIVNEPLGLSFRSYVEWATLANHIHNMWIKLMLNSGFMGMLCIAGLFWLSYRGGSKPGTAPLLQSEPALVVAGTAAIFVAVQFYPGQSDMMWMMLGTLISFNWTRRQRPSGLPHR